MRRQKVPWRLVPACTYRLVDTTSVKGLHRSLGRTWIVVFDEAVVQPFGLEIGQGKLATGHVPLETIFRLFFLLSWYFFNKTK
jgi:hypothetical protein